MITRGARELARSSGVVVLRHPSPLLLTLLIACNVGERRAYVATDASLTALDLRGDAVDARPGDVIMRSSKLIVVVQKPLRDMGAIPYGGNIIDIALADDRIDRFGETQPLYNIGRTIAFQRVDILRDGSDGGPVEVEAQGRDALWDFVNVPGINPGLLAPRPDGSGFVRFDPNAEVKVRVRARYLLEPDSDHVLVRYLYENIGAERLALQGAYAIDTGGALDFFTPGNGFGSPLSSFSLQTVTSGIGSTPFGALVSDDVTYLMRTVTSSSLAQQTFAISIAGVNIFLPGDGSLLDVFTAENLSVPVKGIREQAFEVQVGRTLADAVAAVNARDGLAVGTLQGRVLGGTRRKEGHDIVFVDPLGRVAATTRLNADDTFSATLAEGTYHVLADLDGLTLPRSADVVVKANETTDVVVSAEPAAKIAIDGHLYQEGEVLSARPCRVGVFTDDTVSIADRLVRHEVIDGSIAQHVLETCQGEVRVPPGRYLVQVSHGPLFTLSRTQVDVTAGQSLTLDVSLERISLAAPVRSADFHQHSVGSPDSSVPLRARALGFAAEDVDFFVSSDHDRLTDYRPVLQELGLQNIVQTAVGVETTTLVYGHFNAWPMPLDPTLPSGGSIDWGNETLSLLPRDIFTAFRQRGAAVVQVNHPRSTSTSDFQSFFERAGLVVDPDAGVLGSDPLLQPVSNEVLRLPPGEPLFDTNFDAVELLNGFDPARANIVMRDWFGFLALGFKPTAVGVSDSHKLFTTLPGYPRTYVATPPESEAVASAVLGGRVVASTGPMLRVSLESDGAQGSVGELVHVASGAAMLHVRVDANREDALDKLEVYLNTWVKVPSDQVLTPTVILPLTLTPTPLARGGTSYTASIEVPVTSTRDAFLVVRVSGSADIRPFLPSVNRPEMALSNPIYLDVDGNGAYDPPAQLQR
jgi:hypothetical protein